jgi:carboxymethylenebutenolidase
MPDASLTIGGVTVAAHTARPEGAGPWPAVCVVHEAFGLNDDIRRIADRFAVNGYLAVAPDLVEGGRVTCILRAFRDMRSGHGDSIDTLRGVIDWLVGHPDVEDGRVAVAGFCMGGGFALLMGEVPAVKAIAPNYGSVPAEGKIRQLCPTVASYGALDPAFRGQGERLQSVLEAAGIPNDVKIYENAGHSFMNEGGPAIIRMAGKLAAVGYRHEPAEDAWARILSFFGDHV